MVIEDEAAIADVIRLNLAKAGYGVHIERDGTLGLAAIRSMKPAAVILDIGLPGLEGMEVCRRLRSENDWTPVLFATARDDEIDRIVGLELGADHYVTKPFSPRELVARVTSVLRRSQGSPDEPSHLVLGDVRLDPAERRVFVRDNEVELTATEFDMLGYLMRRPGRVFSREQLISDVWGYSPSGRVRTVDVHIAQVRAKLGAACPIRTVRGVGYASERPGQRPGQRRGRARRVNSDPPRISGSEHRVTCFRGRGHHGAAGRGACGRAHHQEQRRQRTQDSVPAGRCGSGHR